MKVLVINPGENPKIREIGEKLEDMQKVVGGFIEEIMPWDDDVAIICNEEGKVKGLPLNRIIKDENGKTIDIIAGTFFLCYAPIESESFMSMPENLIEKYNEIFEIKFE